VVPETQTARSNREVRYPLLYHLTIDRQCMFGTKRKVVGLTFFDTAGEDLNYIDTMSVETRYIAHSAGLIVLLDPLQFDAVRGRVANNAVLPPANIDQDDIIERVISLIHTIEERHTEKIKIPSG